MCVGGGLWLARRGSGRGGGYSVLVYLAVAA